MMQPSLPAYNLVTNKEIVFTQNWSQWSACAADGKQHIEAIINGIIFLSSSSELFNFLPEIGL